MTQENKELLLKDLCARLPYGVYIEHTKSGFMGRLHDINIFQTYNKDDTIKDYLCHTNFFGDAACKIEYFKPYLFPLSSMTEEQREELYKIGWYIDDNKIYSCFRNYDDVNYKTHTDCFELINWCYKKHLDINNLIPKGLAIDATGLNIY